MSTSSVSENECQSTLASKLNKCFYQAEHQAKLMHLQAEVDVLLQQLQNMKTQRLGVTSCKEE